MLKTDLCVPARFCGPPATSHGGYLAGLAASFVPGSAEVTLRRPVPVERRLTVIERGSGVDVCEGDQVLAEARPSIVELTVPPPVSLEVADSAMLRFRGRDAHPFPGCFACGPDRAPGDGLRLFPGSVSDAMVATRWTPDPDLLDPDGSIRSEYLWAALDCPSGWASSDRPVVLGRLTVHILSRPRGVAPLVVTGWPVTIEGHKHHGGSAVFSSDGELHALSRAVWFPTSRNH